VSSLINLLVIYAFSFVGIHYRWGGNTPDGFDCSGYVVEILKASGFLKSNVDLTSQDLYDLLSASSLGTSLSKGLIQAGAISFYGTSKKNIVHVGFVVDSKSMISAAGGNDQVKTKEEALLAQAFVKLRPINYRKDLVDVIMPRY
jgi:cell wall-associated NlpC family hydrolase